MGGGGSGGGGGTTNTTQKVEPWDAAKPYYESLYKAAQDAFTATPRTPFAGPTQAGVNPLQLTGQALLTNAGTIANNGSWDLAKSLATGAGNGDFLNPMTSPFGAISNRQFSDPGTNSAMAAMIGGGLQTPYTGATDRSTEATIGGDFLKVGSNPYIQGVADSAVNTVRNGLMRTVMPAIQDQSIAQGAYGGKGYGVAQGLAVSDANKQALDATGNIFNSNYQSERDRQVQATAVERAMQNQRDVMMKQLQASLVGQERGLQANLYGQNQQLMAQNYGTERQNQLNSPALFGQAASLATLPAQIMAGAGGTQQGWDQAAINDALAKWNMQQTAPWAGLGEWAQILNGGGFNSAGTAQTTSGASGLASGLQGAAGIAGILGSLAPLFKPAANSGTAWGIPMSLAGMM